MVHNLDDIVVHRIKTMCKINNVSNIPSPSKASSRNRKVAQLPILSAPLLSALHHKYAIELENFISSFGPYRYFATMAFAFPHDTAQINRMFKHVINVMNAKIGVKRKNGAFRTGYIKGAAFIEYSRQGLPHIHFLISEEGKIGNRTAKKVRAIFEDAVRTLASNSKRKLVSLKSTDFQTIYDERNVISYCCKTMHIPTQKGKYCVIDSMGPLPFD